MGGIVERLTPIALLHKRALEPLGLRDMTMGRKVYAKNPQRFYRGLRADLGPLRVTGVSHYIRYERILDRETVYYRHQLRDANQQLFIYTGKRLPVAVGDDIYLRATVKAVDTVWNCVRLMRPVVRHIVEPGEYGAIKANEALILL